MSTPSEPSAPPRSSPRTDRPACPHVDFCELFPKFQSAATLAVWKSLYCERKFQDCARYKRSLEGRSAPIDLLPDGTSLTGATGER